VGEKRSANPRTGAHGNGPTRPGGGGQPFARAPAPAPRTRQAPPARRRRSASDPRAHARARPRRRTARQRCRPRVPTPTTATPVTRPPRGGSTTRPWLMRARGCGHRSGRQAPSPRPAAPHPRVPPRRSDTCATVPWHARPRSADPAAPHTPPQTAHAGAVYPHRHTDRRPPNGLMAVETAARRYTQAARVTHRSAPAARVQAPPQPPVTDKKSATEVYRGSPAGARWRGLGGCVAVDDRPKRPPCHADPPQRGPRGSANPDYCLPARPASAASDGCICSNSQMADSTRCQPLH